MPFRVKSLLILILPFLAVVVFSYYLQGLLLTHQEEFTQWLARFGPYVIIIYILLQVLTVILAPLGGTVLMIGMIALFGPALALTLAYLVVTPIYLINFSLARKYGRPLVERIIGRVVIQKVDHYVADAGVSTLVILRLFLGGYFDYLSYGIGLTKVPFKTFAVINFLAGIPGTVLYYFIFASLDNLTFGILTFYGLTAVFTLFVVIFTHVIRGDNISKKSSK